MEVQLRSEYGAAYLIKAIEEISKILMSCIPVPAPRPKYQPVRLRRPHFGSPFIETLEGFVRRHTVQYALHHAFIAGLTYEEWRLGYVWICPRVLDPTRHVLTIGTHKLRLHYIHLKSG